MAAMELAEGGVKGIRRLRAFGWDFAAASMIPLASFVSFLKYRGYDILLPEVLLACGTILFIAAAVAIVVALRPGTLRPLIFTGLVVVFLYMESKFYLPVWLKDWLISLVGPEKLPNMSAITYVLPIAIVFWLICDKLSTVFAVAFTTMLVVSMILPQRSLEAVTIVEQSPPVVAAAGEKPPPLIHLLIDQQIGIEGLPPEVEGSQAMRRFPFGFLRRLRVSPLHWSLFTFSGIGRINPRPSKWRDRAACAKACWFAGSPGASENQFVVRRA